MSDGTVRTWYLNGKPKGLVAIDVTEVDGRERFRVVSWNGLMFGHHVAWKDSFEEAEALTGCTLTPLTDLGDYPLHYGFDPGEGRFEVAASPFRGSSNTAAKRIPAGTYCFDDADSLFILWLGRNAIDENRMLVRS